MIITSHKKEAHFGPSLFSNKAAMHGGQLYNSINMKLDARINITCTCKCMMANLVMMSDTFISFKDAIKIEIKEKKVILKNKRESTSYILQPLAQGCDI